MLPIFRLPLAQELLEKSPKTQSLNHLAWKNPALGTIEDFLFFSSH